MKINILTIFPNMFSPIKEESLLGKANENGILDINIIDIREYSKDIHKKVDDTPYGGGAGMLMFCQPLFDSLNNLGGKKIYMSPRGKVLDKDKISELSKLDEITILCGHYEGVDQRVLDSFCMEEISIGDYILTGGELAAMVLVDSISRFIPGVLGNEVSAYDESIYSGLLEADQYTKPREYDGLVVPEELLSGNHKEIKIWNLKNAIYRTKKDRGDLFELWLNKASNLIDHPDFVGLTKREKNELIDYIKGLK